MTVTVCGWFQSAGVNVSEAGAATPSVASSLATGMTTSAAGFESSRTVNVAAPPASVVTSPLVGVTVMPATSSSVFVTPTSAPSFPA